MICQDCHRKIEPRTTGGPGCAADGVPCYEHARLEAVLNDIAETLRRIEDRLPPVGKV